MKVVINGDEQQYLEDTLSLQNLIENLGLAGQPVVVELNGQALLNKEMPATNLKDGDRIEIVDGFCFYQSAGG